MTCHSHDRPQRPSASSQAGADDPVIRLIEILSQCTGGVEEQLAMQFEEAVRAEFGGDKVYVPRERWRDRSSRDAEIRAHKAAGRSLGWLSVRYLLSRTQIRRILAEGDGAGS